ncbi:MAG: chorismate-binding protein [Parachlamydiaceae bacterium]
MDAFLKQFLDNGTIFVKDEDHYIIGYGRREWLKEPKGTGPNWYFPDFFLKEEKPWFSHPEWEILSREELFKRLPYSVTSDPVIWQNNQEAIFDTAFHQLQQLFSEQKLTKAVPYLFQTSASAPTPPMLLKMIKCSLEYVSGAPLYLYGFWDTQEGILGATPEKLFSKHGLQLNTMACAGTRSADHSLDLDKDEKLQREHQLVIEGIVETLLPFGSSILVGETKWQSFHRLKHLMTPIEITLNEDVRLLALIKALHPTPAIGAYPKKEGNEWILSFDQIINRGRFGAPCACTFQNKALCLVAIRNVQWSDDQMKIGAGSGIIQESLLENEKREIAAKISSIKRMLGYE